MQHVLWVLLILASMFMIALLLSSWLGAKVWPLWEIDMWLVLDRATITSSFVLTSIALYGLRKNGWLWKLLQRQREDALTSESLEVRDKADVLVMLYHQNEELADWAIRKANPQVLALLGSDHVDIASYVAHLKLTHPILSVISDTIEDPYCLESAESKASDLILQAMKAAIYRGADPKKIICDITGTTKPMTLGMQRAAERLCIDTVYITSKRENKIPVKGTQQFRLIRRFSDAP